MDRDAPDAIPEDVPIPKVPIEVTIVADAADEYDVDARRLVERLEDIHAHVAERARELTEQYTREFGSDAVLVRAGVQQHLYVDPDEWPELRSRLDLDGDVASAARAAHDRQCSRYVETLDGVERVPSLETNDVLVVAPPIVQDLLEAGLSLRQANVQALRMRGDSQARIAEKLGIAEGTVKSHCDRVDRKIERAERLLELVERPDAT